MCHLTVHIVSSEFEVNSVFSLGVVQIRSNPSLPWHCRFGYAEFPSGKEAKKAMEDLADQELDGRVLRLDIATPRSDSGGAPSGRGAPRGGRGAPRGGGLTGVWWGISGCGTPRG